MGFLSLYALGLWDGLLQRADRFDTDLSCRRPALTRTPLRQVSDPGAQQYTPPPSFMNSNASSGSQNYGSNASSTVIAQGRDSTGEGPSESPPAAPKAPEEQAPLPEAAPVATVVVDSPVAKAV